MIEVKLKSGETLIRGNTYKDIVEQCIETFNNQKGTEFTFCFNSNVIITGKPVSLFTRILNKVRKIIN